ncbi:alternative ribosome rescue aminoacyl-tRNA hydrolase ArfB [Sneathiella aquimaris]|uniref:alternative ribosome rescue aminoacyl-tRNA hydrolase ArfB n=1 Tax=Sneathiella aquimaris TaxID=2599305 RepID=UPI00146F66F8|nr:alternative ribosome rescue aminoacyl-tRNA hydrolase ArfB [Sneathiella aquimaris]
MIQITPQIFIHDDEIEESFIRSSGPGGQNVNKVSSAVQLRFDAKSSASISETLFNRMRQVASHLMTKEGVLIITAESFRSQERNRADAKERLSEVIRKASIVPKTRRPTKPTYSSKLKRMDKKKQRGTIKKNRGRVSKSDFS